MLAVDKVHHNAAHAGNHRHAHGMAENGRLRCELLFKNLPCGFEIVVVQRLNAGLLGGGGKVAHIGVAELGKLLADAGKVIQQALHAVWRCAVACVVRGVVIQRLHRALGGAGELGRIGVFGVAAQVLGKLLAGLGLQADEPLDAVD